MPTLSGRKLRLLWSQVGDLDPRLEQGVTFLLYGSRPHSMEALRAARYRLEGRGPGARRGEGGAIGAEIQREFRLEAGKPPELDL